MLHGAARWSASLEISCCFASHVSATGVVGSGVTEGAACLHPTRSRALTRRPRIIQDMRNLVSRVDGARTLVQENRSSTSQCGRVTNAARSGPESPVTARDGAARTLCETGDEAEDRHRLLARDGASQQVLCARNLPVPRPSGA